MKSIKINVNQTESVMDLHQPERRPQLAQAKLRRGSEAFVGIRSVRPTNPK
jgi:hypothetical protein